MSRIEYTNQAGEKCLCSCTLSDECSMDCGVYRKITGKQTNADRIRAMTDAELAKWLCVMNIDDCPDKAHERHCTDKCYECWLDWLKCPAEVEE